MNSRPFGLALLADRHHGLTESLRGLLETSFTSVVMVADEASLIDSAQRLQPTAAVVDDSLFLKGGVQWLAQLKRICPQMLLVVLSVHDEPAMRQALLGAGADCFVLKRDIPTKLLSVIESALESKGTGDRHDDEKENPGASHPQQTL